MRNKFNEIHDVAIVDKDTKKEKLAVLILLSMGGIDEGGDGGSGDGGTGEGGGTEEGGYFDEGETGGTDNIPGDEGYDGDPWGDFNGFGSPANPIALDEVTITPANEDNPNAWGSLGRTVIGIIEVVTGIVTAPESGGAGIYLIIDGIGRTGLNLTNFLNEIKGNNVPALPTNFGGAIGLGFSNKQGAYWGTVTDDVITALVGGGLYADAEDAVKAMLAKNYLKAVASGATSADDANTIKEWFESH